MSKLLIELCRIEGLTAIFGNSVLSHFREFHQNPEITGQAADLLMFAVNLAEILQKFYRKGAFKKYFPAYFNNKRAKFGSF